ncbi:Epimerase domain-containing protein [Mycena indigotica]|uniref:Epimerase domain-containing protein n=1 Tax=Mycena indigotica TaxID=2126181 RepID=A0A8H6W308_9AGAR|nr:Epimerase domain-containing protein [Mycena indigotica]KAF7297489.1 Epimerase domain-containing protein [Mycena indigotica]
MTEQPPRGPVGERGVRKEGGRASLLGHLKDKWRGVFGSSPADKSKSSAQKPSLKQPASPKQNVKMAETVLVTGATGFLGSHVVLQLLEKGYSVRAIARGDKATQIRTAYGEFGARFEVVEIADLATEQLPAEKWTGVSALLHLATPMPGRVAVDRQIQLAIDGTLNIVVQAEKAGVKKIVVTSSVGTARGSDGVSDKHWSPITKEYALGSGNPMLVYVASKKLAEQALWEWADAHPHVEVTTLNPTFLLGPFTKYFPVPRTPSPRDTNWSTVGFWYQLLFPDGAFLGMATTYIDVRDAAAAHVAAIGPNVPATATAGRKRILVSAPNGWPATKLVEYIGKERPALKDRLLAHPEAVKTEADVLTLDWARVETVLGLKKTDFHTTETTVLDTVDSITAIEDKWRADGHEIVKPSMG